ncbi:MAG TPA: AAA family ATPase [Longimicrobium sp.]|nr:AAA family ATPase [Longimicrobium sp.]
MSLWHLYNLRESPFFQEQLTADPEARYPIELFVGRTAEVERLVSGVRQKRDSSSRQTVQGPPGIGKSTLVQQVKAHVAADGVVSHPGSVSVAHADTTQTVLLRILGYVYAAILGNTTNLALLDRPAMVTAKQLVIAFQARGGGGGLTIPAVGGVNLNVSTQYITPTTSIEVLVPNVLAELSTLVREQMGASGVLVHLDNLENLSDRDADAASRIVRDLRDPVLMAQGYHWVLVGTNESVRTVVGSTLQVRDVFSMPRPLLPLSLEEVRELLGRRYAHLRVDASKPFREPVMPDAVADLHAVFGGNVRGLLLAMEESAQALIEFGGAGAASMTREQIRFVLQGRMHSAMQANLDLHDARHLTRLANAGLFDGFTQSDIARVCGVNQSAASKISRRLEDSGYLCSMETPSHGRAGRPVRRHYATALTRLAFNAPAPTVPLP